MKIRHMFVEVTYVDRWDRDRLCMTAADSHNTITVGSAEVLYWARTTDDAATSSPQVSLIQNEATASCNIGKYNNQQPAPEETTGNQNFLLYHNTPTKPDNNFSIWIKAHLLQRPPHLPAQDHPLQQQAVVLHLPLHHPRNGYGHDSSAKNCKR
jgi:hypothetical protein